MLESSSVKSWDEKKKRVATRGVGRKEVATGCPSAPESEQTDQRSETFTGDA